MISWLSFFLLLPYAFSTAPVALKTYYTQAQVQGIQVVQFKVDFDQPVFFYQKSNLVLQAGSSIVGMNNSGGQTLPNIVFQGQGSVSISCLLSNGTTFTIPNTMAAGGSSGGGGGGGSGGGGSGGGGGGGGGAPNFFLTCPPTSDPLGSMLNSLFGGLQLNETYYPNRYAVAFPLSSTYQTLFTQNPVCTITPNSANDVILTNANKEPVTAPITALYKDPQCSYSEAVSMQSLLKQILAYGSSIQTINQVSQMQNLFSVLTAREAYAGCKLYISSMLTFGTVNVNVPGSTQCTRQYGDPLFATDPCCSGDAAMTSCCAPRTTVISTNVVTSVLSSVVAQQCQTPAAVQALLLNAATAAAAVDGSPYDSNARWTTLQSFIQSCYTSVYQTTCQSDADCPYSGSCNVQSGSCAFDYTNPGPPLVKCFLATMSSDMKLEFKKTLGLPTVFATPAYEISNLTASILSSASSMDCVGPTSNNYHSQQTYSKDSNGNYVQGLTPGNQTGCVGESQCSYQPWNRISQQQCSQGSRPGFCAQTQNGGWLQPITQFSRCQAMVWDQTSCSNITGSSWENQNCLLPFNTSGTCLTGPMCQSGGQSYACSQSICYNPAILSSGSCSSPMFWDTNLATPACRMFSPQSQCPYTFVVGRTFQAGMYDSANACPSQTCNYNEVTQAGGSTNDCYGLSKCTSTCSQCQSYSYPQGGCLDLTITTSNACQGASGVWNTLNGQNGGGGGGGGCLFTQYNQTTCASVSKTWSTCLSLSQSACGSSATAAGLYCSYSSYSPCATQQTCLAAGTCDDWEYGNSGQSGACVYSPAIQFRCANGDQQTRIGTCINSNIRNSLSCTGGNNTWVGRANSSSTCLGKGSYCLSANGQYSVQNASSCASCGGTSKPFYRWITPQWLNGSLIPTTWTPVAWVPKNQWIQTLDNNKLQTLLQAAAGRIIAREILNKYNAQFNLYTSIFSLVGCDCIAKLPQCFSAKIVALIGTCSTDPTITQTCNGVTTAPGTFPQGQAVTVSASLVSSASFVNPLLPSKSFLSKFFSKASTGSASTYAVVSNSLGLIVGQLIGNGRLYSFSTAATGPVTICLSTDPSIPQDSVSYTILDFANSTSTASTLSPPMNVVVSTVNGQLCASVDNVGLGATYFPVLRNAQLSVAPTTTTSTAVGTITTTPTSTAFRSSVKLILIPLILALALL